MKKMVWLATTLILVLSLFAVSTESVSAADTPVDTETNGVSQQQENTDSTDKEKEKKSNHQLTTNGGSVINLEKIALNYVGPSQGHLMFQEEGEASAVYFTKDISSEALVKIYEKLSWNPEGKLAIKITTGESAKTFYLRPELIGDLTKLVKGTLVECNTAYQGNRSDTEDHYRVAEERGYTKIADVDIMDEEGSMTIPVNDGTVLKENYVGTHFKNYSSFIVLSHFKGHDMGGFGGAIKNTSIGIASAPEGKINIHNAGIDKTHFLDEDPEYNGDLVFMNNLTINFQKSMAEATKSVSDALDGNIVYINIMNNISVNCDCDPNPREPDIHDVGILASKDPVALDQACVELAACMDGSGTLLLKVANLHAVASLEHGEEIGLGSRYYNLICID